MASTAKADTGQSSRKRSRPPQAAPPEAAKDSQCPICLGHMRWPAYVTYCMHKFCLKCIWLWSRARDSCPVCRQPIHQMPYSVQGDREYKEYTISLAARLQRMAREGGLPPVSAATLRMMQAASIQEQQHLYGRSRPTDTNRAQRQGAAPGPSNAHSQQAPAASHKMAPLGESEGPAGPAAPLEPQNGTE